ncbi:MAG: NusG domain II-containing protein [Synergistaceae bacterium]|nr:NusG domain II-containing protein [Synergistaceae bacterium]
MKRGDRLLAAITLTGCALLAAWTFFTQQRAGEGLSVAEIALDGRVVERLPLNGPPREIRVESAGGFNIIRTENGRAAVVSADCPDGVCVRQGWISRGGGGAVCLPHKLVVRIIGLSADVDGVSW